MNNCTSLVDLICYNNKLTNLEVNTNIVLGGLSCQNNFLASLNVTDNIKLLSLNCSNNDIKYLDVSYNPKLRILSVADNTKLEGLELTRVEPPKYINSKDSQKALVAPNIRLSQIEANNTGLVSLDISNVPNLRTLNARESKLTSLDVSNNSILSVLDLTNNPLACIQVAQEQIDNIPSGWVVDATTAYSTDCENYLGVDDELLTEGLILYPNPVSDILTVDSKLPLSKIEIYSILGQRVKEINSDFNAIPTNYLSRGIYMIKIYSEKGITVRKLIKRE